MQIPSEKFKSLFTRCRYIYKLHAFACPGWINEYCNQSSQSLVLLKPMKCQIRLGDFFVNDAFEMCSHRSILMHNTYLKYSLHCPKGIAVKRAWFAIFFLILSLSRRRHQLMIEREVEKISIIRSLYWILLKSKWVWEFYNVRCSHMLLGRFHHCLWTSNDNDWLFPDNIRTTLPFIWVSLP